MLTERQELTLLSEEEKLEYLVGVGKDGNVPMELVIGLFPNADEDKIERLFQKVEGAGITITAQNETDEDSEHYGPISKVPEDDTVGLYLAELTQFPLLTFDQEQDLAKKIEAGKKATIKLASTNGNLRKQEKLAAEIEEGEEARDTLTNSNLRLVVSVAKKYQGRGLPFLDLIQEGNIGLLRGVQKFDYRRGLKFSTYATRWIRQAVGRAISDHGKTVRIPAHYHDRLGKLKSVMWQFRQEQGREAEPEELAEQMEVPTKKIEMMLKDMPDALSLDEITPNTDGLTLGQLIEDDKSPNPHEEAQKKDLRERLEAAIEQLPPRDAMILRKRYGLADGKTYTLEALGRKFGLTRERIRQIEQQGLKNLRRIASSYGLE